MAWQHGIKDMLLSADHALIPLGAGLCCRASSLYKPSPFPKMDQGAPKRLARTSGLCMGHGWRGNAFYKSTIILREVSGQAVGAGAWEAQSPLPGSLSIQHISRSRHSAGHGWENRGPRKGTAGHGAGMAPGHLQHLCSKPLLTPFSSISLQLLSIH